MNWMVVFEIVYFLSAVICAVAVPYTLSMRERSYSAPATRAPLKYYMTYGQIIKGVVFALIPVVNTSISLFILFIHLDEVKIFKERFHEDS
jgi:hypothetical protein